MLKIRVTLLPVALLVLFTLTIGLMAVRAEVIPDPSSKLASVLDTQERTANQNKVNYTRSYRSPLDDCFDVSLMELANCYNLSQTLNRSYRSLLNECFDVSLIELDSCRNAGKAPAQIDRSTVDACANLPPNGPVSCTNVRLAHAP